MAVMDVNGPHYGLWPSLTLFHDLYGSSQLQTGDKLLPELFLMTENDIEKLFPALRKVYLSCLKNWPLCGLWHCAWWLHHPWGASDGPAVDVYLLWSLGATQFSIQHGRMLKYKVLVFCKISTEVNCQWGGAHLKWAEVTVVVLDDLGWQVLQHVLLHSP